MLGEETVGLLNQLLQQREEEPIELTGTEQYSRPFLTT